MHMKYQIYLYLLVWFTIFIEEYAFFAYVIFRIYGNFLHSSLWFELILLVINYYKFIIILS